MESRESFNETGRDFFFNKKNKTLNKIMESDIYVTWQNLRKPNYHLRIHE